ncbi:MAG TPA: cytochrome P450 [Amycolatopsis sp.]|nr:cytochrome P450 [Amycolatopsis sp.]
MTTLEPRYPAFLSEEVAADPYDFYRTLRRESPVHFDPEFNGYLLSRHADVAAAYRNPLFSSRSYEKFLQPVFGRSLLQMDGTEHTRKRALVSPYFRGKGLQSWMSVIARNVNLILDGATRDAAHQLSARFEPGQTVDLLEEFGYYLPVYVITNMLGLPHDDYDKFFEWYTAHTNFSAAFGRDPEIDAIGRQATADLWDYLTPVIEDRRRNPGTDLISALVLAEFEGERLDDIEIKTHATQLLNAGSETTGKTLANLFTHLLSRRELFESVRDDRAKLLPAISETLRFTPPSQMNSRQTTEDVVIDDVRIPANSTVMLLIASANRDERRFSHPEEFDPARADLNHDKVFTNSNEHFAFGGGRHFCLGAMLAKSELEVGTNILMDRFPDMRLADDFEPRWSGLKMRSVDKLVVTL